MLVCWCVGCVSSNKRSPRGPPRPPPASGAPRVIPGQTGEPPRTAPRARKPPRQTTATMVYPVISFSCPRQDRLIQGKPCTSPPLPPSSPGDQSGPRRARRLGASVHHFWLSSDPDRPRPGKPHTAAHQPSRGPPPSTAAGRTIGQNPRALACLR